MGNFSLTRDALLFKLYRNKALSWNLPWPRQILSSAFYWPNRQVPMDFDEIASGIASSALR